MKPITILTTPVERPLHVSYYKRFGRRLKRHLLGSRSYSSDGINNGPSSVLQSLINGLDALGYPYNVNPTDESKVNDIVLVLSGVNTLQQALAWKSTGAISYLLAGPNILTLSFDSCGILSDPAIDKIIVASRWIGDSYLRQNKEIGKRIQVWAAGVDVNRWNTLGKVRTKSAIIYWKTEPKEFIHEIKEAVEAEGFDATVLKYGEYSSDLYLSKLQSSYVAIFISRSETQGIAMFEAWATDTPTLVWKSEAFLEHKAWIYDAYSSAPYLSPRQGLLWTDIAELRSHLRSLEDKTFTPREWVKNNHSDLHAAKNIISIINNL